MLQLNGDEAGVAPPSQGFQFMNGNKRVQKWWERTAARTCDVVMGHEVRIRLKRRPKETLASIARPKGFSDSFTQD
jgi:hypothetical protein